jgi:copper oxidase (laccase) domain-containing protein
MPASTAPPAAPTLQDAPIAKKVDIFDGQATVIHTGTAFGTVHPKHPEFPYRFTRLLRETGQGMLLAQNLGMNTTVTPIDSLDDLVVGEGMRAGEMRQIEGFHRTPEKTDGVVVSLNGDTRLKTAVAIMNADCGVIEILAPNGEMAVLHGAFNCVDNPDGSSIVTNAIAYFKAQGFEASELQFRVGEAAQACCYGFKTDSEVWQRKNANRAERLQKAYGEEVAQIIQNLPRRGGIGFNVPLIAARQAEQEGVQSIKIEELCTSCHGLAEEAMNQQDTYGTWHSNVREKPETIKTLGRGSRNAMVVFPT